MSFTYDLTTSTGMIRLYTGDITEGQGVRPNGTNFSDEELAVVMTQETDDWHRAVAAVCEICAVEWARVSTVVIGPRREEMTAVSKRFEALAKRLRGQYGGGGAASAFTAGLNRDDGYAEAAS